MKSSTCFCRLVSAIASLPAATSIPIIGEQKEKVKLFLRSADGICEHRRK
jgi:hypothetical protein